MPAAFPVISAIAAAATVCVTLAATPRPVAAQWPAGTYQSSCRELVLTRDGHLQGECKTSKGVWNETRIRISQCKGRDIANSNGRLVCATSKSDGALWADSSKKNNALWADSSKKNGGNNALWSTNGKSSTGRPQPGIILYHDKQWKGENMAVFRDAPSLVTTFDNVVSSVRIVGGGTWRLCANAGYAGKCVNVSSDVRDLSTLGIENTVSSIRKIR